MEFKSIKKLASKYNWKEIDHQDNIFLISFSKEDKRINVYYSKMTVGTCLNHPIKGKTQLFRKKVDENLLEEIFKNPRVHTSKGYRKK